MSISFTNLTRNYTNSMVNDAMQPAFGKSKKAKAAQRKEPKGTKHQPPYHEPVAYTSLLSQPLPAYTNSTLASELARDTSIHNRGLAFKRVKSFSNYMKKMVGFIPPGNIDNKEWFEHGCTYLIKGSAGINIPEVAYPEYAKQFWGLLAKADPYWTSDEFITRLKTFNNNAGVQASINALTELKPAKPARNSNVSFGRYESLMKYIPELLQTGCAYSGTPLNPLRNDIYPSLEHIFPHSEGGDMANSDYNFALTLGDENGSRGNIPLIDFLKGWNAGEFEQSNPSWKEKTIENLIKKFHLNSGDFITFREYKSILSEPLKSDINPGLTYIVQNNPKTHNADRSIERISSLSRYLKEEMVGFVTLEGKQWFEEGCANLIKSGVGVDLPDCMLSKYAKDFWNIMAIADNYWTSDNFINYLGSLEQTPAVKATIEAVESLQYDTKPAGKNPFFTGSTRQFGFVDKIYNDGCAYSGNSFSYETPATSPALTPLINPDCITGNSSFDNEENYILTTKKAASEKGDMPLNEYLRGWNASEYHPAHKHWQSTLFSQISKDYEKFIIENIDNTENPYYETNPKWCKIWEKVMKKNAKRLKRANKRL